MKRLILPALLLSTAQAADLATPAETLHTRLAEAGVEIGFDRAAAAGLVRDASQAFDTVKTQWQQADPKSAERVTAALNDAQAAIQRGDEPALARARAEAWSALLYGANQGLEKSVKAGDAAQTRDWLAVREFRVASKLSRLNADATEAIEDLAAGKIKPDAALAAVRSDVLDGYQARFNDSLRELQTSQEQGFHTLAAEQKALAQGYFELLADSYTGQRGEAATRQVEAQLAALPTSLSTVQNTLQGFRAALLSEREVHGRASQVLRFLSLVPVEYARGVQKDGDQWRLTNEVEINEARTFLEGSVTALSDVSPLLKDQAKAKELAQAYSVLAAKMTQPALTKSVISVSELEAQVDALLTQTRATFPADWQKSDANADLDVIRSQFDAVVTAAEAGDWTAAENARLDAYSLLESGTEARIAVFNPDLKTRLEDLIWNGTQPAGLATLIQRHAPASEFKATRAELQSTLAEVGKILGTDVAPAAVATNAGIIVFREGLEAVLILAALMGSLRKGEMVKLRRPMWLGAAAALFATGITWAIMQQTLSMLGKYGEKLEAVVGVIAIGVLLLIMNWFFHQVYWTDRMASFQKHKHELTHGQKGASQAMQAQWWGLAVLGFTSIYREGFETVLFLQSLILQAGAASVLSGTAIGLASVLAVGVAVFKWQAKLPMKKLLIWTGMLICAVLGVMVGNTTHILQLVGWLRVHPLPFEIPAWLGLWLGLHATWEGVVLQIASMIAVIGSFFAAEALKERELKAKREGKNAALSS